MAIDKVTLEDIAKDSGYSISTVSRVLNGSEKISEQTKETVYNSATKLKYPISINNNGYSNKKYLNIALIVSGFHIGEFYASFYKGFTTAAEENNILLSIVSVHDSKKHLFHFAKELSKTNDGLILFTPEYNRTDYLHLQKELPQGFPVVSNVLIENPVFSTITFDGYSGGHLAAAHFHTKGYLSCGVIKGPFKKPESRYRFNGFQDYLTRYPSMKLTWCFNGDFTFESGLKAFEAYQHAQHKPRAIFACNDAMCHAFMEQATKTGYRFPEDIAIIGFDDLPICQHHQPTISSITTAYDKLGHITMETLQKNISHPEKQKGMLSFVPVSVNEREST